jgi:predicted nucleotidyltransferase
MMHITNEQVNTINEYLEQALQPYLVMLFGSAVNGRMRPDSDIDIAFLSDRQISSYQQFLIAQELAGLLGCEVHLVDLRKASTVFQAQVVGKGKVILDKKPTRRQEFFILVLKQYARLNEERAPVLMRIRERGSVYAR